MLVALLVIIASMLALGLLALLDHAQFGAVKSRVKQHKSARDKLVYYDAFADHHPADPKPRTDGPRLAA